MSASLFQPFPMLPRRRAQVWRHQPSFRRPRHFHPEPELNIVFRGHATMGVGDDVVELSEGDVLLFHPGQDHELLDASADLELSVLALRPDVAERACSSLAHVASLGRLACAELRTIRARLTALADLADANVVESHLGAVFKQVQSNLAINHVLSRRALQEICTRPQTTGSGLAEQLGVAPSVLSRHFHEDLGLPFVTYRARQRTMAFVRLVDSGQSLTRAALEAGFGSYAQCHRVTSSALGCPPQRYFGGERVRIDDALNPAT